jgi:hypothetical protein
MILQERSQVSASPLRVDREAGIIYGVKIIGTKSANGRDYPIDMLAKAAPLYEASAVNINHPDPKSNAPRSVADNCGELRGVTIKTGADAGLYADWHYNRAHALAGQLAEAAERFPTKLGLSHNADGSGKRTSDGRFLVESIARVISVDVVLEPATNSSLFEGSMKLRNVKISEMIGTLPTDSHERRLLSRMIEEEGMSGDTVASVEDQPGPEEAIKAAFRAEIIKAFDDSSLDAKATLNRIKEVIKAHEKVQNAMAGTKQDGGANPAESKPDAGAPGQEGVNAELGTLREEVARLTARDQVRELLREAKREVTAEQFDAIVATPAAHRKTLIESVGQPIGASGRQVPGGQKPRTTGSTPATGGGEDKPAYQKGEKFMEHLHRPTVGRFTNVN